VRKNNSMKYLTQRKVQMHGQCSELMKSLVRDRYYKNLMSRELYSSGAVLLSSSRCVVVWDSGLGGRVVQEVGYLMLLLVCFAWLWDLGHVLQPYPSTLKRLLHLSDLLIPFAWSHG